MFFPDLVAGLRDMARVTRPGGRVAVQVFDQREQQPAYGPWIAMVASHAGADAVRMLGTYWRCGDRRLLREQCAAAGLQVVAVHDHERPAHFPSVEAMVRTEVGATPLAERLSPAELDAVVADSFAVLAPFRTPGQDSLTLPLGGFVLVATPGERPVRLLAVGEQAQRTGAATAASASTMP